MTTFTNDFSREIWENTYKYGEEKTIDDTFTRVAKSIASVEKTKELQDEYFTKFLDLLSEFKFVPGGRILSNAGTCYNGTTLINCFTGPMEKYDIDSLDGILTVLKKQSITLKSEGGWGMNFSFIRPRGSLIHGVGVETPGAVKYMELFDKSSDIITSGSGKESNIKGKKKIRKGAQLALLWCWHPDIEEFITSKQTPGRLTKFNISVAASNEFMDKVVAIKELENCKKTIPEELDKWDLIFPDTTFDKYKDEWNGNINLWKSKNYPVVVYRTVSVRYLWNLIVKSTYNRNDPGVIFFDVANKTYLFNYGGNDVSISSANACGEQTMPNGHCCNLASFNLTQFIKDKKFDFEKFEKYIPIAVRFSDNVNDVTKLPLPEYKESATKKRRIGLGVMGWGSMLYLLGIKFSSKEAEELKDKIFKTLCFTAIKTSTDLAKEKGAFVGCVPEKQSEVEYFNQIKLPKDIKDDIKKHGLRNSSLFSVQPTGNTAILVNNVSGGLEPVFAHEYIRTTIIQSPPEEIKNICPKYWEGKFEENDLFKQVKEGDDIILKYTDKNGTVWKIDKNRGLTKETLCEDYAVRLLKKQGEWNSKAKFAVISTQLSVEEHITDVCGFAKWLDASCSKTINIPNNYPLYKFEDVYLNTYKTGYIKGITTYREGTTANVLAPKEELNIIKTTKAQKRPKELPADIHHFVFNRQRYYVAVGLFGDNKQPYEIFLGINHNEDGEIVIPKQIISGTIVKLGNGKYELVSNDKNYHITNGCSDDTADALTRMVSLGLRHGSEVSFVVSQLEKIKGPIISFSKIICRALKKYVKDGTVSKDLCPDCNKNLLRQSGCLVCPQCGFSKCG